MVKDSLPEEGGKAGTPTGRLLPAAAAATSLGEGGKEEKASVAASIKEGDGGKKRLRPTPLSGREAGKRNLPWGRKAIRGRG